MQPLICSISPRALNNPFNLDAIRGFFYPSCFCCSLFQTNDLTIIGRTPGAHQSCSITPLLSWTGEKKIMKVLWFGIMTGKSTHQSLSQVKQTQPGGNMWTYCQSNQNRRVRNPPNFRTSFPFLSLLPELNWLPNSLSPPHSGAER